MFGKCVSALNLVFNALAICDCPWKAHRCLLAISYFCRHSQTEFRRPEPKLFRCIELLLWHATAWLPIG